MLKIKDLNFSYGHVKVLRNVSLDVPRGKVVCVMGRNGVGKTTLLKNILGLLSASSGSVVFDSKPISSLPTHHRVRAGLAYVPQGRMIFPKLTVGENLRVGMSGKNGKEALEEIFSLFPVLKEMLSRREREAKTKDETALIAEEKIRLRRHQEDLKRLLKSACLSGSVYFQGNDRSPGDRATEVGKTVSDILGQVLPGVFERFKEAAARPNDIKKGLDALLTAENLNGLPQVFGTLGLLRDERGRTVFRVETPPLAEVMSRIEERANYGDTAGGRSLTDEFATLHPL